MRVFELFNVGAHRENICEILRINNSQIDKFLCDKNCPQRVSVKTEKEQIKLTLLKIEGIFQIHENIDRIDNLCDLMEVYLDFLGLSNEIPLISMEFHLTIGDVMRHLMNYISNGSLLPESKKKLKKAFWEYVRQEIFARR